MYRALALVLVYLERRKIFMLWCFWEKKLLGHFALRAPSRRVWRVDFGVMEWGVMRAAFPLGCCVVGVAES